MATWVDTFLSPCLLRVLARAVGDPRHGGPGASPPVGHGRRHHVPGQLLQVSQRGHIVLVPLDGGSDLAVRGPSACWAWCWSSCWSWPNKLASTKCIQTQDF